MTAFEEILRSLEENGGNGLVNYTPPGSQESYQMVILGKRVVAVTMNGQYQPRTVAEEVVRKFAQGLGTALWVPFPVYYPPLHLMFFLPVPRAYAKGSTLELSEGGEEE